MKFDLEHIRELIAKAKDEPSTGNTFVDALYESVVPLTGHTNPYYALFHLIAMAYEPNLVVELGSWRAIAAAHFAVGGAKRVLTIDIHREDKVSQEITRDVANRIANLTYINGWTWDDHVIGAVFKCAPIDILYIDAWHEYKYAIREWELYSLMLADGALVICDDIFDAGGATEDMVKFWNELPGEKMLISNGWLHGWVPMGFMKWTK